MEAEVDPDRLRARPGSGAAYNNLYPAANANHGPQSPPEATVSLYECLCIASCAPGMNIGPWLDVDNGP